MDQLPFDVSFELEGWALFWADLELSSTPGPELVDLRIEVARRARTDRDLATLASDPTVTALRRLFRAAGCDPTRYRPASEALLRRILKGADLPAIHPLVDLNNCLSVELAVPCCVMAEGTLSPPLVLRAGHPGESYESLRGPFNLEAKPLLVDQAGPCDAPITGSERVKVRSDTQRAWLVSYLPAEVLTPRQARQALERLLQSAPVAKVRLAAGV